MISRSIQIFDTGVMLFLMWRIALAVLLGSSSSLLALAQERLVETGSYAITVENQPVPALILSSQGQPVFRLPLVSGLSTPGGEEKLTGIKISHTAGSDSRPAFLNATANSSLWSNRRFVWKFFADHIEFQQFARGDHPVERCYFFSNGISDRWTNGQSQGVAANTTIYADRYFSPRVNHADQQDFTIAMPQSVGIAAEAPESSAYDPLGMDGLFVPPPLAIAFHRGEIWTSVGIATSPGKYSFNGLEYSGSRYAGAAFWVNEQGREDAASNFSSPVVALHFGYSQLEALSSYIRWVDANGFSTQHRFPNATWHRLPIFCGWAEQTVEASERGIEAHDLATQENYESWITILEKRGLPFGTIVIDDKWQEHYGTFDVDQAKWPDLGGFVRNQHAKHRHVLLWVPAFHVEGLPDEFSLHINSKSIAADVSNPAYETFLRARIKHLVNDLGIDGFKEDWLSGLRDYSQVQQHSPLYGIEFLRRFQFILYDETHKWKPDAMVETQTPNPLFRESSDVLRLNDVWYGARNVPAMMKRRAQIAWLAGWPLVDCDNASSTDLEEWWNYMRFQPTLGTPALYFVHKTESTKEVVPNETWGRLAQIWTRYIESLNTQ